MRRDLGPGWLLAYTDVVVPGVGLFGLQRFEAATLGLWVSVLPDAGTDSLAAGRRP